MAYVSDDQVIINIQGLRTVSREDWLNTTPGHEWRLNWTYKGQWNVHEYADQAASDAMYNALRRVLAEKEQQRQSGGYRNAAIRVAVEHCNRVAPGMLLGDVVALVEALEPIMRPGGQGDAV